MTDAEHSTSSQSTGKTKWLTQTVVAVSIASLFSDACYESIIPLLPAFIASLGGGALALGTIEGLADAVAAGFKLWGGQLADRSKRRRLLAGSGYLAVGLFMPAIAFAHSILGVGALRVAAWLARGFRGPIRDTLIVDDTDPKFVNRAFGFQRGLDTVGAVIGPATAMILLARHVALSTAIATGFIPGVLAAAAYFFVRERPRTVPPRAPLRLALAGMPVAFKRYVIGAGVFGLGNFSTTLLILAAIRALTPIVGFGPALVYASGMYLGHNVISASLSYPLSVASERLGVGRLLVVAFGLFASVCAVLAFASTSVAAIAVSFAVAAIAGSIIEPMEATLASELLPAATRGTGFGALAAVNGIGDFVSSAGAGALWQISGPLAAFGAAGAVCLAGIALVAPVVWRLKRA
jgi:MFS family permease